jgi:hypothetical protein
MLSIAIVGMGVNISNAAGFDFDGRSVGASSFMEEIKAAHDKSTTVCHQVCYPDGSTGTECTTTEKSAGIELPAVSAPVVVENSAKGADEARLNQAIGTAIKDCEKKGFSGLKSKFEKLHKEGTLQEKWDFAYNKNRTYEFPRRLFAGMEKTFEQQTMTDELAKMNKACLVWGHREECTSGQKEVCSTICDVGAVVCMVVAGIAEPVCTVGAPVCHVACHFVPDTHCTTINYCEQEGSWPGMQPVN